MVGDDMIERSLEHTCERSFVSASTWRVADEHIAEDPPARDALVVAFTALFCLGIGDAKDGPSISWPTQSWHQGTPASVGLDEKTLASLDADFVAGKYGLVDSFQVFRCGRGSLRSKVPP